MEDKIKPCPFCGNADIRFHKHANHNYTDKYHNPKDDNFKFIWSMCCYECGATFPNRYKKELLVECWNRRPKQ